jgi:hypothetical protein
LEYPHSNSRLIFHQSHSSRTVAFGEWRFLADSGRHPLRPAWSPAAVSTRPYSLSFRCRRRCGAAARRRS